jgi:hypothetical protein
VLFVHIKPRRQLRMLDLATGEEAHIASGRVDNVCIYSLHSLLTVNQEQRAVSIFSQKKHFLRQIDRFQSHNTIEYPLHSKITSITSTIV